MMRIPWHALDPNSPGPCRIRLSCQGRHNSVNRTSVAVASGILIIVLAACSVPDTLAEFETAEVGSAEHSTQATAPTLSRTDVLIETAEEAMSPP
ncbi:MAG: hypothetical protein OXL68_08445 [Paracoccaceae bacterium]|nr:hypothetical protein [Paracoccaceae bacterium]